MAKFIDDKQMHIEDDIIKIQTKPFMYVGGGERGVHQLVREGVNNHIDECTNVNSPGDEIDIHIDEIENTITMSDNGRGMPFDAMEKACTKLQAGSKFYRDTGGATAGENGVGMTAMNALSESFEMISRRYGEKATLKFENGVKKSFVIKKDKSDNHGFTVRLKPNAMFLGEDILIKKEIIMEWLETIIAATPNEIKITLSVTCRGKDAAVNKKYRNKEGMLTLCKKHAKKPVLEPIHFMRSKTLSEKVTVRKGGDLTSTEVEQKELSRLMGLELAFTYDSTRGSEILPISLCNFVVTGEHGVHADATRNAIVQYLSKAAKAELSEKEAKTIDIITADVTRGLVFAVYLSTELNPMLGGQTKEKVTNAELFHPIKSMVLSGLDEYFRKNPKELKRAADYIKVMAKARINENKARAAVVKNSGSLLDMHAIPKYYPANNKAKNDYRELFIIEGDSAAGSANSSRFRDFQALYAMRGVPKNTFKVKWSEIHAKNAEFRNLVIVLRCLIGDRFDINLLYFNKIIIMTDADVDGSNIFSLICAFFMWHLPEVVKDGRLYKAVSPLYKLKDNKRKFILNKREFIDTFEEKIGDSIKLINSDTSVVMSKDKFKEFLLVNRQYLEDLTHAATYYSLSLEVLEAIAINIARQGAIDSDAKRKALVKALKPRFPELKIDEDNNLTGIFAERFQITKINDPFYRKIADLIKRINVDNKGVSEYYMHEKSGKGYEDKGVRTIGMILSHCQKFTPNITKRYKGLGELNPEELRETTLDPNNRTLIQLTVGDLQAELDRFDILHGNNDIARKEMMKMFKINREDIDN